MSIIQRLQRIIDPTPQFAAPSYDCEPWEFGRAQNSKPSQRELVTDLWPPIMQHPEFGITDRSAPNDKQQRKAYRGLIYRCANIRANAWLEAVRLATVERRTGQNESEEVEGEFPWLTLLRKPSPHYSARFVWKWVQLAKDLSKGAFLLVEYENGTGMPKWLHPIFPAFGTLNAVGNSQGGIESFVFYRSDGQRIPLAKEQVIWIRHPHPVTPFESASLLEAAAYEIDIDLFLRTYRRDSLKKGGWPEMYLSTEQSITRQQGEEYGQYFRSSYQGIENVGQVPVFGKGLKPDMLGLNAKDLQFIEGSKLTRSDILDIWGVPEGMITDKANRANADAAKYTFVQQAAQPEADDNCDQLTADFREAYQADENLVIQPPDLVPLDPELLLRQDREQLRTGQRSIDELRERDGKDPWGGVASRPMVEFGMMPMDDLEAPDEEEGGQQDDDEEDLERRFRAMSDGDFDRMINRLVEAA